MSKDELEDTTELDPSEVADASDESLEFDEDDDSEEDSDDDTVEFEKEPEKSESDE